MSTDLIANLTVATYWINQIFPLLQIFIGTIGNIFNIIIFTRRELRNNPCSLYFLIGSINNCFVLDFSLLSRYLADTWKLDLATINNLACKMRNFFTQSSLTFALWFIVLASIDRYLSSSPHARFRQLSSLSVARKSIGV